MRGIDVRGSQLRFSPAQLLISCAIYYMQQLTTSLLELLYTKLFRITVKHTKRYLEFHERKDSAVVHA